MTNAMQKHPEHRESIFQELGEVISHWHHKENQHVMRLTAPKCAATAVEGQFVHIECDSSLPLRRPLSIMRTNADEGWIDLLYKAIGQGTSLLAKQATGTRLSLLGPIGKPFVLNPDKPIRIMIGGGVGIPPMIFIAESIQKNFPDDCGSSYVFMGSESPFPFRTLASRLNIAGLQPDITHAIEDVENLNIASRLASMNSFEGCHQGYVTEIAEQFMETLSDDQLAIAEIFSCGPHPMLAAVKALAEKFDVSCQVSLEEYMACAVGGCAGCVVEVETEQGPAMKRVCVDGPVFDARTVNF